MSTENPKDPNEQIVRQSYLVVKRGEGQGKSGTAKEKILPLSELNREVTEEDLLAGIDESDVQGPLSSLGQYLGPSINTPLPIQGRKVVEADITTDSVGTPISRPPTTANKFNEFAKAFALLRQTYTEVAEVVVESGWNEDREIVEEIAYLMLEEGYVKDSVSVEEIIEWLQKL